MHSKSPLGWVGRVHVDVQVAEKVDLTAHSWLGWGDAGGDGEGEATREEEREDLYRCLLVKEILVQKCLPSVVSC
jgi:hypothetical protein